MQNEIIVESYWCNKSYLIYNYLQSSRPKKKKSKLKPKKHEDRLDKDGEAGEVSAMMLKFQYHGVTQTIVEVTQFKMPCGTYDPL